MNFFEAVEPPHVLGARLIRKTERFMARAQDQKVGKDFPRLLESLEIVNVALGVPRIRGTVTV